MSETEQDLIRPKLSHRLLLSLLIGLLVWAMTLTVAWRSTRQQLSHRLWVTHNFVLPAMVEAVAEYKNSNGSSPRSLTDLDGENNRWYQDGVWIDGWGNPLASTYDGVTLLVTSYGRDGKPGGTGLDHDLTNLNPKPDASLPTFRQFLFQMPSGQIQMWCAVIGVVLFTVVLRESGKPKKKPQSVLSQAVEFIIVAIVASLVGGLLMVLHTSGH